MQPRIRMLAASGAWRLWRGADPTGSHMKRIVILVEKSQRPHRWAGVALLAAVLGGALWAEHKPGGNAPVASAEAALHDIPFDPPGAVHLDSAPSFAKHPLVEHTADSTAPVPDGTAIGLSPAPRTLSAHPR
jgi:hypothetical protein